MSKLADRRPRRAAAGARRGALTGGRDLCLALLALASALAPALAAPTAAQPAAVTLEQIMADPDWIGNAPESPYWADDGKAVYYRQKRSGEDHRDLWRIDLDGDGAPQRVADAELGGADVDDGALSADLAHKVYSRAGDIYLKELATGAVRQLTRTADVERAPRFLLGDRRVTFTRGTVTLIRDLDSGLEAEAAELRLEKDPDDAEDPADYLGRQQRRLFEILRRRREQETAERERDRAERAADPSRLDPAWYLGDEVEIETASLAPSGDWMLLATSAADRQQGRHDQMPNYVTEDGYVASREVRVKVGTGQPVAHRLWLLDLAGRQRRELDLAALPGIDVDPLAPLRAAAEARRKAEEAEKAEKAKKAKKAAEKTGAQGDDSDGGDDAAEPSGDGDDSDGDDGKDGAEGDRNEPRPVYVGSIAWSHDGARAAVQLYSWDNKDRWLALVGRDGTLTPIHRLQDDQGWINWRFNDFGWLRDGSLYYLSEESGWSQLYRYHPASDQHHRLTAGDHVVDDPEPSRDQRFIYYTANPDHPGHYDTFRVPAAGGDSERLTRLGGLTSSRLSPDGEHLLITHSTTTEPPELFLQEARPGAEPRRLTTTVSDAFAALPWRRPEIVAVPSSHQPRPIHARLYRPQPTIDDGLSDGKRPAVVFVHGAGYLQNAHGGWSGYFREFMFHTLLTQAGYVVLDMDYRASRGYGRDWRTAIYRRMGTPEVEDLADGVEWLVENQDVDRARIGVYGGSYGGFLTFMAMFRRPELFACGAALRPVTDWAHYNHPYTSNILNTPEIDPEAYARSSPIEFADGLGKPLLICTGMQDDNVFFQDSVRLVQRLIELGKQDFETAIYPLEPHGFREPSSWLDEYRRIFKLFETHLKP